MMFDKKRKTPRVFAQQPKLDELDYLQQIATQLMVEKERGEININRGRLSLLFLGGGQAVR